MWSYNNFEEDIFFSLSVVHTQLLSLSMSTIFVFSNIWLPSPGILLARSNKYFRGWNWAWFSKHKAAFTGKEIGILSKNFAFNPKLKAASASFFIEDTKFSSSV